MTEAQDEILMSLIIVAPIVYAVFVISVGAFTHFVKWMDKLLRDADEEDWG